MRIQQVKIKEFKILKNFEKEINGSNILLIGDNGVGKSTLIQFIEIALGKNTNIPPNATGEGEVITDKNGNKYIFHVKFKDGKPVLTVTAPDGIKDSRKSAIASIVGAIDFNVDEFVKLSDSTAGRKKQVEIYKSLLPDEIVDQLDKMYRKVETTYNERTETTRKAKTLEGFIKESPLYGENLNIEPVDVSDLTEQLKKANEHNGKINEVKQRYNQRCSDMDRKHKEVEDMELKIKALKTEIEADKKTNQETGKWMDSNNQIDTQDLTNQINKASEQNQSVVLRMEHKSKLLQIEKLNEEVGELTVLIDSTKQSIADAIRDMDAPVEGLMFDAEQLIYNNVPVSTSSLSSSEIIHLGCKLKMAQNPEFGVLFIEHGESIGQVRMKDIQEMATKYNWQIIMEQVQRGVEELRIEFINE